MTMYGHEDEVPAFDEYSEQNLYMDIVRNALKMLRREAIAQGWTDDIDTWDYLLNMHHRGRMQYEEAIASRDEQINRMVARYGKRGEMKGLVRRFDIRGLAEDMGYPADDEEIA